METSSIEWSKYKAVVFDFDGTLYEGKGFGKKLVFADLLNAFKSRKERIIRKAMAGQDFGDAEKFYNQFFSQMGEKHRNWYFQKYLPTMVEVLRKHFNAREGAQQLIDKLEEQGIKVCVLSDYPMVEQRVKAIGLNMDTSRMWSTETKGALKPGARPFKEVAERLEISTSEMLVIGDRADTDGMGAKNAGCDCVIINTHKNIGKTEGFNNMDWADIIK